MISRISLMAAVLYGLVFPVAAQQMYSLDSIYFYTVETADNVPGFKQIIEEKDELGRPKIERNMERDPATTSFLTSWLKSYTYHPNGEVAEEITTGCRPQFDTCLLEKVVHYNSFGDKIRRHRRQFELNDNRDGINLRLIEYDSTLAYTDERPSIQQTLFYRVETESWEVFSMRWISRDENGWIDTLRSSSAIHGLESISTLVYQYDALGNKTKMVSYGPEDTSIYLREYTYDDQNRRSAIRYSRIENGDTIPSTAAFFTYEDLFTHEEFLFYNTAGDSLDFKKEREVYYLTENVIDSTRFFDYNLHTQERIFDRSEKYFYSTLSSSPNALDHPSFAIFPNPAREQITIRMEDASGQLQHIAIYDLAGRVVRVIRSADTQILLDISDLSRGMYLLRLNGGAARKLLVHD